MTATVVEMWEGPDIVTREAGAAAEVLGRLKATKRGRGYEAGGVREEVVVLRLQDLLSLKAAVVVS